MASFLLFQLIKYSFSTLNRVIKPFTLSMLSKDRNLHWNKLNNFIAVWCEERKFGQICSCFWERKCCHPEFQLIWAQLQIFIACSTKTRRFCIIHTHSQSKLCGAVLCSVYVSVHGSFPPSFSFNFSVAVHLWHTCSLFLARSNSLYSISLVFVYLRARTTRIRFVHRAASIARCLMYYVLSCAVRVCYVQ